LRSAFDRLDFCPLLKTVNKNTGISPPPKEVTTRYRHSCQRPPSRSAPSDSRRSPHDVTRFRCLCQCEDCQVALVVRHAGFGSGTEVGWGFYDRVNWMQQCCSDLVQQCCSYVKSAFSTLDLDGAQFSVYKYT